jgi:hypothetical protein
MQEYLEGRKSAGDVAHERLSVIPVPQNEITIDPVFIIPDNSLMR